MEKSDRLTLDIRSGTVIKVVFILLAFVLAYILRDIVIVILTSVVIASAVEPATAWFKKLRIARAPAVLLVYIVSFGLFFGLLYAFIPPVVNELSDLSSTLPERLKSIEILPSVSTADLARDLSVSDVLSGVEDTFGVMTGDVARTATAIFGGLLNFVLIVVISFYLAVQERGIENFLRVITPTKNEHYVIGLWQRTQNKIGLWAQGQLLLGVLVGMLVFLGLMIFRIEYAFLLAILAAVFELIPVFGPILAAVPAMAIGFNQSPTLGIIITCFYLIIQQFENHLFYPLVVKKIVGIPSIAVILALLVGAKLAGFLGLILAVPVATLLIELADDLEKEKMARAHQDAQ